jgi:type IV secretion system protein TrbJ
MNHFLALVLKFNGWIIGLFGITPFHLGDPVLSHVGIEILAATVCAFVNVGILFSPLLVLWAFIKIRRLRALQKGQQRMKRTTLAAVAALPLLLIQPAPSKALIVECANCSDLVDQAEQIADQVKQLAQQAQSYQTQLLQYQNMLTNSAALPMSIWSSVSNDLNQVRNLANSASLLTSNSGSILTRLQSAQSTAYGTSFLPANIGSQFQMWSQTQGNAANTLGRTLAAQQSQQMTYASQQASIQAQSQAAAGQMQAIQAGNQLAGLTATQLNQVQATLTAAAQEQATRDIVAQDRTNAEDAAELQFFQSGTQLSTTGGVKY